MSRTGGEEASSKPTACSEDHGPTWGCSSGDRKCWINREDDIVLSSPEEDTFPETSGRRRGEKKRADEEAARLYEEFVESFKGDDVPGSKAFVRGGTINPNDRLKHSSEGVPRGAGSKAATTPATAKKPGSRYVPSFIPPGLAAMVNKEPDKRRDEDRNKERERGKSRNIDHFMEELKREQEAREKRNADREHRRNDRRAQAIVAAQQDDPNLTRFDELPENADDKLPGSFDDGDPQTTNLYVGNLSPQVDENFLLRTFGRFGPIASVKIMWPRTEEERRRQRNCGFVAFMNRDEAQAAKDEMQGIIVYEYELRIGWGKAVSLPAQALPAPPPGQMAVRAKEGASASNVAWSGPGAPPSAAVSSQNSEVVVTPNVPDIQVVPPEIQHLRHIIDTTAMYVLDDGCAFEQAIMERGRGNTLFDFLFDLGSSEHTYYIWRLYSFAQGDTLQRWRTEPFIMITGSGRWIPPALPPQDLSKSPDREKAMATTFAAGRGRRVDLERALTDSQRDEFEDMLRALTLERSQIREAMGFALDNAEAAEEVVEVLTESLTLKETPIPTKVARLMLVSDVLHNSSAPVKNASAYRTGFEARLPDIMESFNDLYRNITGRITAEALKERVLKVLQVWADWFLFSDAYVNGLRATFLRSGNSGVPPFHTLSGDMQVLKENGNGEISEPGTYQAEGPEGEAGQDAALAMGEGAAAIELASLPLAELERRCRHNGLSIRGGTEVMVARLLSLEEAEKQKNQEQEEEMKTARGFELPGKPTTMEGTNSVFRSHGEGRWSSGEGRTEIGTGWREVSRYERGQHVESENGDSHDENLGTVLGPSGLAMPWPRYSQAEEVETSKLSGPGVVGAHSVSGGGMLPPTLIIPPAELKVFGAKVEKTESVLPASKWAREDDISDDDDNKHEEKGLGLGYSSSGSDEMLGTVSKGEKQDTRVDSIAGTANDTSMDEGRRQKLRRVEVAIIEYRESLEERGIKSSDEIEKKVALQRKKLETDYELLDGPFLPSRDRDPKGADPGVEPHFSRASERGSLEVKHKRDERRDSVLPKKRTRSRSRSPSRAKDRSSRERERDRDRDREQGRD